jgi:hypothetical protein
MITRRPLTAHFGYCLDRIWVFKSKYSPFKGIVALHVNSDKTADLTKETSSSQAASVKRC